MLLIFSSPAPSQPDMGIDMRLTASRLRQDIYRILDQVLESGVPVEIERRGRILRIVPPQDCSKLDSLRRRDVLRVEPEELVHVDWSDTWRPDDS